MAKFIDRDKALSFPLANGKYDHKNADEHFIYGCETYKEWLEQLPTVEPKRGEWIVLEPEIDLRCCSICGHKIIRADCNYCPNCGARMMEVSEDA